MTGRLALAAWLATIALIAAAGIVLVATWSTAVPDSWGFRGATIVIAGVFGTVGVVLAQRRPENRIGWLFSAIGGLFAVEALVIEYVIAGALAVPGRLPLVHELGWLLTWIWVPPIGLALIYLPLLFPTGRLASEAWRPVARLGGPATVLAALGLALAPGPIQQATFLDNPLTPPWIDPDLLRGIVEPAVFLAFGAVVLAALASLGRRFGTAAGDVRQQLKWFAYAAVMAGLALTLYFIAFSVSASPAVAKALEIVIILAVLGLPVAAGIAVLRYRLYEIDRVISRTLAYAVVTGVLTVLFVGIVLGLQAALAGLTQGETLAVAISTLVVAALFQPVRARVQRTADRRFNRSRYDAERTVAAFADRLRDEVDLRALRGDLSEVAYEALHPARVGVWIRSGGGTAR